MQIVRLWLKNINTKRNCGVQSCYLKLRMILKGYVGYCLYKSGTIMGLTDFNIHNKLDNWKSYWRVSHSHVHRAFKISYIL